MIHTKSLVRRLAYVPWLLAFGLVLGWAGEAQAQAIKLSLDTKSQSARSLARFRSRYTATADADVPQATTILLDFGQTATNS